MALGKNILSNILPAPTISLNMVKSTPVKMGENHVPKVAPTVKYALKIRLNAEIFIKVNIDSYKN